MAKKEKIKDLKPNKISDEKLIEVQKVVQKINTSQMELGQIETRKHSILHYIASVSDELTRLRSELEEEYGTDDINIQDGTIRYPENGQVNKED